MLVYLALGSNLGDRETHLRAAVLGLSRRGVVPRRSASIYLTEPRDLLHQPWFLNTVIEAETDLAPDQLLHACMAVEEEYQRVRDLSKGPRTIDIDIIFYGSEVIQKHCLTVPHPRYARRRFVLEPLAELVPGFLDPLARKTVRKLLDDTADTGRIQRVAPPLL